MTPIPGLGGKIASTGHTTLSDPARATWYQLYYRALPQITPPAGPPELLDL